MSEIDANILVEGQKTVATVPQEGEIVKDGGATDATCVVQGGDGKLHKAVKIVNLDDEPSSKSETDAQVLNGNNELVVVAEDKDGEVIYKNDSEVDFHCLVKGDNDEKQLAVKTVEIDGEIIKTGGATDATCLVQGSNGKQLAVKVFNAGGSQGWKGKPESWPDIRENLIPNSIRLLADERYPLGFTATATGGYTVKIDGEVKGTYASGAQCSIPQTDWPKGPIDSLTAYGATEQRNLPVGYTEYDGLIGDGTAYIDLNCTLTQDDEIEIELSISSATTSRNLFGYRNSASSNNISVLFGSAGTLVADFNSSDYVTYRLNETVNANTRYKLVINKTGRYLYRADNGSLVGSNTNACADTISCLSTYLFNTAGSPGATAKFDGTIHRCLIKGKRDVVPCGNGTAYGMYDKLNSVFYPNTNTGGSFTVGNAVTPTPDVPMDIVCNNGVVKVSPNLLNENTITYGGFISTDGSWINNNDYGASDYIQIKNGVTYVKSNITSQSVAFYNASKTFVGRLNVTSFTATYDGYVRINLSATDTDMQFEQGSTATSYMAYGQIYTDGTVETIGIKDSNNLLPVDAQPDVLYPVTVTAAGFWTASANVDNGQNLAACEIRYYNADKQQINYYTMNEHSDGRMYRTFSVPTSTKYVSISLKQVYATTPVTELKVEIGDTMTPYYNGGTATAEMLLKVGDYQDTQEVITGSVTRRIGIKVLDGSENWDYASARFNLELSDKINAKANVLCNCFAYSSETSANMPDLSIVSYTSRNIGVRYDRFTSVAQFKQWLADQYAAGTPVIVVYPLATPTTESVTPQALTGTQAEVTAGSISDLQITYTNADSGYPIDYPVGAETAHIIDIYPTTEGNNITVFKCQKVGTSSGYEEQGVLWTHFNLTNTINLNTGLADDYSHHNNLMKACTAKNNVIKISGLNSCFHNMRTLEYVPTFDGDNNIVDLYASFYLCLSLEKINFKNTRFRIGANTFNNAQALKKLPKLDYSDAREMQTFLETNTSLEDTVLDVRAATGLKVIQCTGWSEGFMSGFKGLRVSSSAPFSESAPQISVSYTGMDRSALVQLFNDLPTVTGGQIINITGTTGSADLTDDDKAIATDKGWTIAL